MLFHTFNILKPNFGASCSICALCFDFEQECEILKQLRNAFSIEQISIRLDANGAFSPKTALQKLEKLSVFSIHSIEQPIQQWHINEMAQLCKQSPIPIALDEDLIGIYGKQA